MGIAASPVLCILLAHVQGVALGFCTCAASDVMLAVPLWHASCKLGLLQVLRSPIASGTLGWR